MEQRVPFVRVLKLSRLLEIFFIASVTSILVIRAFLASTGYPQLGGHGLHIAHLLWGGLLMLIALVLLLSFIGRNLQSSAALLGGIGFGTFIDELGKFITSDNNYFFQPAIPLIYIIFVLLFLSFRELEQHPSPSARTRLANALHILAEMLPVAYQRRTSTRCSGSCVQTIPMMRACTCWLMQSNRCRWCHRQNQEEWTGWCVPFESCMRAWCTLPILLASSALALSSMHCSLQWRRCSRLCPCGIWWQASSLRTSSRSVCSFPPSCLAS